MLRIGTVVSEPDLFECGLRNFEPRKNCSKPGIFAEIFFNVLSHMHVPYEIFVFDKKKFGDDIWSVLYDEIRNGSIDTMAADWTMTKSRLENLDFSFPTRQVTPVFIVRKQSAHLLSNSGLAFEVFSLGVWLGIFGLVVALSVGIISYRYVMGISGLPGVWNFFRYVIHQNGTLLRERHTSGNILILILGLMSALFAMLYQGTLLATLLYPTPNVPFEDPYQMIELIGDKKQTLVAFSDVGWHADEMKHSNRSYFKLLRRATQQNPIIYEPNSAAISKMLQSGPFVHATTSNYQSGFLSNCNLTVVSRGETLPAYWRGLIFPKDSEWKAVFDEQLIKFHDFAQKVVEEYQKFEKCDHFVSAVQKPLSMTSMSGVFVLFCALNILAICTFLLEHSTDSNLLLHIADTLLPELNL